MNKCLWFRCNLISFSYMGNSFFLFDFFFVHTLCRRRSLFLVFCACVSQFEYSIGSHTKWWTCECDALNYDDDDDDDSYTRVKSAFRHRHGAWECIWTTFGKRENRTRVSSWAVELQKPAFKRICGGIYSKPKIHSYASPVLVYKYPLIFAFTIRMVRSSSSTSLTAAAAAAAVVASSASSLWKHKIINTNLKPIALSV